MLILTRGEGEGVVVPKARLEIRVEEIRGNVVRLGFKAPHHVEIFRHEVWTQICFDEWDEQDGPELGEDHK